MAEASRAIEQTQHELAHQDRRALLRKLSNVGSYVSRSLQEGGDGELLARKVSRAFTNAADDFQIFANDVGDFLDLPGAVNQAQEEFSEQEERGKVAASKPALVEPSTPSTSQGVPSRPAIARTESTGKLRHLDKAIFRDKAAFFIGVFDVVLTAWWIGASPSSYYHLWTFKCATLFPLRWLLYKRKGWHYLMFEYCYVANFVGIWHLYFAPHSPMLRNLTFSLGAGPLMWSIMAMRNSLVFHDADRMTTLMMHASPALVAWTLRWYPSGNECGASENSSSALNTAGAFDLIVLPVLVYLVWVVSYYFLNFVLLRHRIERNRRMTMFSLMVPKHDPEEARKSMIARVVLSAPPRLQVFAYLGVHATAAMLSFLPTLWFFHSFAAHSVALMFCLGLAAWNGGGYYFHVFAKKYMARLEEAAVAEAAAIANGKSKDA